MLHLTCIASYHYLIKVMVWLMCGCLCVSVLYLEHWYIVA